MATGVLVLAIGEATKLVPWLTGHDKSYLATVAFGVETDTLDADGTETACSPPSGALIAALAQVRRGERAPLLEAALDEERRRTCQIPPAFSAIKTAGVRSFTRARRGAPIALRARDVVVARIDVVGCAERSDALKLSLDVGKGYYVRALARDLAASLGTVAHLIELRRIRSGPFVVEEALPLDVSAERFRAGVVPLAAAAERTLPVVRLTSAGARHARHGRAVPPSEHDGGRCGGPSAWLDPEGALVAIGEVDAEGNGTVVRGFAAS
jgi:tRNA pseudouridine55 synthase